jgi:N12 class adenine-specific DNA methylase
MSNSTDAMQLTLDLFAAPPATPTEPPADPTPAAAVRALVPDTACVLDRAAAPAERWQPREPALLQRLADAVPSGMVARWNADVSALTTAYLLHRRLADGEQITDSDRDELSQWSGWGGLQSLFGTDRATEAEQAVRALAATGTAAAVDVDQAWARAQATTINAHYTHPQLAAVMWQLAYKYGYRGGPVLEPGCGSGLFVALAPAGVPVTGVELDPSTAAIAQLLHPDATVLTGSFSQVRLKEASFALAIGNVPFADYVEYDPKFNAARHTLHNYFLVKSLRLLEPGALAVLISTHFTLDAISVKARRDMAALGELVEVVRLPTGAHNAMAGTEALTDILVFRRHADAQAAGVYVDSHPDWLDVVEFAHDGGSVPVNHRLAAADGARFVLGTPAVRTGMYAGAALDVDGDHDPAHLAAQIRDLFDLPPLPRATPAPAPAAGAPQTAPAATTLLPELPVAAPTGLEHLDDHWDGHLIIADGKLHEVRDGDAHVVAVPATTLKELRPLLALRDMTRHLLDLEASTPHGFEDEEMTGLRTALRNAWSAYVAKHGAVNRYTLRRTGRTDESTGEDRHARVMPKAIKTLLGDPSGALVLSLENFDDETQNAAPAAILIRRVLSRREPVLSVDTPAEALAVCLEQHGRVELEAIASLLSIDVADARATLGSLVFEDPDTGRLVPASEYLSGNVRRKLAAAREAAAARPEFQANVDALTPVLPAPLGVDDITAQVGAVWISAETHQQFLADQLDATYVTVEHGINNIWHVKGPEWGTASTSTWGTRRMPAPSIFKALLTQSEVTVYDRIDTVDGERRVLNADETAAAVEKAQAIAERFSDWAWEDQERAQTLLDAYNTLFNSLVLRDFTSDGDRLTFPGMSEALTPTVHQRAAVARIVSEPAVGLFHAVGAGKTLDLCAGASYLKRLGFARKPCIVVPNHMLEQMSREFLQLYPHARVLAACTEDLTRDRRRLFIAKIAANDWDAIIITGSAFSRIPIDLAFEKEYLAREIARIKEALNVKDNGDRRTHNEIQKMLRTRENRLRELSDRESDPAVSFEATGIDYLLVDEAHLYKNLATESNISDAKIAGSKRATDLHMKLEYLRSREGERVVTFATATPIANSITEAYVMQRYLRPDLFQDATIHHFDQWAATFGERVTALEMAPTGGGNYRIKTRFAKFRNVPEMLRMWQVFADVKTPEDLDLPRPAVGHGAGDDHVDGPRTVVIPTPPEMQAYLLQLAARAERLAQGGVDPTEDNMLKVTGDGRRAALDMRLIDGTVLEGRCKLEYAADEIAAIHHANADRRYLIPGTDMESTMPGALQIVFCDLSTPKKEAWNAYDELRRLLAERGIPVEQVRFIHQARNDAEKARLFEACRTGKVSVIVGSTEKMGVGTNIQARAVALHHLDCPWRPADLEQRDGRALRQGNQNPEIQIIRYVVEQTFDAYNWQTVERKARFIGQITRGKLNLREIDDISDNAMSFAEVKALASGDPLILDHATAMAEVQRLQHSRRAWERNQGQLRYGQQSLKASIQAAYGEIERVRGLLATVATFNLDEPEFQFRGVSTTDRYEASRMIRSWLEATRVGDTYVPVGSICGVAIHGKASIHPLSGSLEARLVVDNLWSSEVAATMPAMKSDPLVLIRPLLHSIASLDQREPMLHARIEGHKVELDRALAATGEPFKGQQQLVDAQAQVARIEQLMREKQEQQQRERGAAPTDDTYTAAPAPDTVDDAALAA